MGLLDQFPRCADLSAINIPDDSTIDDLPIELRVCYHIQPWNNTFVPESVENWADVIGWVCFRHGPQGEFQDKEISVQTAIAEAQRLLNFLQREVLLININVKKTAEGGGI